MLFGEYLVHAGVVTQADVLSALEWQNRRRPFLPQLAVDLRIMNASEAMATLNQADRQQRAFAEVAAEAGLLSQEDLATLARAQRESVPPIGTLLLAMGRVDAQTLKRCLEHHAQAVAATVRT